MEEDLIEKKKAKKEKIKKSEKQQNVIFDALAIICIIIMAIAVSPKTLQNDTYYNVKCGEYILNHGIFHLNSDPFSWHNLSYTWPHWLYDLLTYLVFHVSRKSLGTWFLYFYNCFYCHSWNLLI